ncbi:MAG: inositol monophosphatase family protein [Acetobacteraceae bacterium]
MAFERLWDLRCASIEYMMAASGHVHILYYRKVMPWDHCPGYVLLTEAGGYGALHHGAAYRIGHKASGLLYAPDQHVWHEVTSALGLHER